MTKRLIDIDDDIMTAAMAELETTTYTATVNEALRQATERRRRRVRKSIATLAGMAQRDDLTSREDTWR